MILSAECHQLLGYDHGGKTCDVAHPSKGDKEMAYSQVRGGVHKSNAHVVLTCEPLQAQETNTKQPPRGRGIGSDV